MFILPFIREMINRGLAKEGGTFTGESRGEDQCTDLSQPPPNSDCFRATRVDNAGMKSASIDTEMRRELSLIPELSATGQALAEFALSWVRKDEKYAGLSFRRDGDAWVLGRCISFRVP